MTERYRTVKIYMTATIEVLVNDGETLQEQKMTDQAIDFVQCLGSNNVQFEMAEFDD